MRGISSILRAAPPHLRLPAQRRFKTSKTGEEGQFKAVAASQSSHEPTKDKTSKPPHQASRPEVKKQAPTHWGRKNGDPGGGTG